MAASPSPSSDEQFALGSVLDGRYRIDAVLGTGGMGRVYRAEHTKIGKLVAIKVLHADLGRNREASQRFQREAIASGRLDHPNIVGVSDFGTLDDGCCYLVMEVLEGESLGDRLARDHRIHWVEAIEILRGVLHGLRHAHERGVVHRDIKPDNVYLARKDGDPIIKILDFGIAKLYAGTDEDPAQTRAGLTVGTPAYLSPEQAVGGEITPKSDLYSASILLYEMLAGRAPFEDKDPLAMLGAHVSRRPAPFAETAPGVDIPQPLEDIMQHGLMKLAAERIASADDYLALLDGFAPPIHAMPRFATSPGLALSSSEATAGSRTGSPLAAVAAEGSGPDVATSLPERPAPGAQLAGPDGAAVGAGAGQAVRWANEAMPSAAEEVLWADQPGSVAGEAAAELRDALADSLETAPDDAAPLAVASTSASGGSAAVAGRTAGDAAVPLAVASTSASGGSAAVAGETTPEHAAPLAVESPSAASSTASASGKVTAGGDAAPLAVASTSASASASASSASGKVTTGDDAAPLAVASTSASAAAAAASASASGQVAAGDDAVPLAVESTSASAASTSVSAASAAVSGKTAPVSRTAGSLPVAPVSLEMPRLRAKRAASIADVAEPIPRTWIVRSGVFVAVVIVAAISLTIVTHCGGSSSSPTSASAPALPVPGAKQPPAVKPAVPPATKPPATKSPLLKPAPAAVKPAGAASTPPVVPPVAKPAAAATAPPVTKPPGAATAPPVTQPPGAAIAPPTPVARPPVAKPPGAATIQPAPATAATAPSPVAPAKADPRDAQLKTLLRDLELGRTCGLRKVAVGKLAALRHPGAIVPLKRALGRTNINGCLAGDAERAIKALGGTLK